MNWICRMGMTVLSQLCHGDFRLLIVPARVILPRRQEGFKLNCILSSFDYGKDLILFLIPDFI